MRDAIVFEGSRTGYSIDQLFEGYGKPMTVGELREILEEYDDDDVVIISHDHGYTYGSLGEQSLWREDASGEWDIVW